MPLYVSHILIWVGGSLLDSPANFLEKLLPGEYASMLRYDTSSHATPLRQTPVREQQHVHVWWHLPDLCQSVSTYLTHNQTTRRLHSKCAVRSFPAGPGRGPGPGPGPAVPVPVPVGLLAKAP